MASHYNLRKKEKTNYQELSNVILPRPVRSNNTSKLYAITVVEEDGERVKVHYEGYDDKYDEWKEISEIVDLSPLPEQDIYQLFELHHELASYPNQDGFRFKTPKRSRGANRTII